MQNNPSMPGTNQNMPAGSKKIPAGTPPSSPRGTPIVKPKQFFSPPPASQPGLSTSPPPGVPPTSNSWLPSTPQNWSQSYPPKLDLVDNGRVVRSLQQIREKCEETSPSEIYLVLNPSEVGMAAEAQFSKKAHVIEGWRNSLILLPIMITWISLGLAGLAYTQSINLNPRLVAEPLLQQWAEGFTILRYISVWSFHLPLQIGQWRYFTFGDVAVLDFFLFVILLILTLWSHSIEVKAHKDAIELSTWLREECDNLRMRSYARALGPGEAPPWAAVVNKAIADLQGTLKEVVTMVRSFDELLKDDRETVSKALSAVYNLNAIYESGRDIYEKLNATLPHLDRSFERMAESQDQAVRSLDKVAESVNSSSDAVIQLARPFATVGVAHLANEVFNQLQQVQKQQRYIYDALGQQIDAVNQMNSRSQQPPAPPWWDVRRFLTKLRRTR